MDFISKEPIHKGFSIDKKFRAKDCQGYEYLLRIAPMERYQRRKQDYEYTLRFLSLGIPMCVPLEFGICDEGVYSVQRWIDGIDLQEVIPLLSDNKQYAYGMEAGRALKQLHKFPMPEHLDCWETVFRQKVNSTIEHYQKSTVQFPNAQIMIDFIQENIHYSAGRPRVYLHGDYHIGNLLLAVDNKLYIGSTPQHKNRRKSKHNRPKYDRIGAREMAEDVQRGLHKGRRRRCTRITVNFGSRIMCFRMGNWTRKTTG